MADRVRFIMDSMALYFRQLSELKLFSQDEIKIMIKKRTDFEYVLRRRQLKPSDFQGYLEFEINLDRLQTLRAEKFEKDRSKDSVLLHRSVLAASIRHIAYIFERAIRRFPSDMSFWEDFIAFLKLKKSNAMLNRVYGKALSLHPTNVNFWLQASMHELENNGNAHAARVLLQRGIRSNKGSSELWSRYFDLELWSALRVTERKKILEIGDEDEAADLVEAAPLVVFKHAIDSLHEGKASEGSTSKTIHPALLQMHKSCEGIVNRLSLSIEKVLRKKFGGCIELWEHLLRLHVSRVLPQAGNGDSTTRKRSAMDPIDTLDAVALALERAQSLIAEASNRLTNSPSSAGWTVAAIGLLNETICRCLTVLAQLAPHMQQTVSNSVTASNEEGSLKRTAKKARKSSVKSSEPEQDLEILKYSSKYSIVLDSIRTVMDSLLQAYSSEVRSESISSKITLPLEMVSRFHLLLLSMTFSMHRFSSSISNAEGLSSKEATELSDHLSAFVEWVQTSSSSFFNGKGTSNGLEGSRLLSDWSKATRVCLRALHRNRTAPNEVLDRQGLVRKCIESLIPIASLLLADKEGCVLLQEAVAEAGLLPNDTATEEDIGFRLLEAIIESKPCSQSALLVAVAANKADDSSFGLETSEHFHRVLSKGEWCVKYVQYKASLALSGYDDSDPFVDGYYRVMKSVRSKPQFFSQSDIEFFYGYFLNILKAQRELSEDEETTNKYGRSSLLASSIKSGVKSSGNLKGESFPIAVMENAVQDCPSVSEFWDFLIDLHRCSGNHAAADAVMWRRQKLC